jgi:transposase
MNSIAQRSNPAIENLFREAGDPKKVMCLPIDYAKGQHTAMVCNGLGERLRGVFHIHNSPAGVAFVEEVIDGLCRKHAICKEHVFFGGEDCSAIAFNFIDAMLHKDFLGIGLNARDVARERESLPASTDAIDVRAIAVALFQRKLGRTLSAEYGEARNLRELTHHRGALVKARTASAYRLHHLVDQLLPGFLDEKRSGITPFSQPALWLMRERFSPREILARRTASLVDKLSLFMVRDPEKKVAKLKELARNTLPPPAGLTDTLQINLGHEVSVYEHLHACIHDVNGAIARQLAPTPGALLTTVQGIGITLAAQLYGEIGDPNRCRNLNRVCSYAGLAARVKQSGGPDKPARTLGRSRRACVPLKRCIADIALKVGQYGHEELRADYRRRINAGQDPRRTMARRLLRICAHIIRQHDFFKPPSLQSDPAPEKLREYYLHAWDKVLIKWRDRSAIKQALAKGAPLEEWRQAINALHGLNLSKLSPQYDRLRQR